jgi:hypothetical protein
MAIILFVALASFAAVLPGPALATRAAPLLLSRSRPPFCCEARADGSEAEVAPAAAAAAPAPADDPPAPAPVAAAAAAPAAALSEEEASAKQLSSPVLKTFAELSPDYQDLAIAALKRLDRMRALRDKPTCAPRSRRLHTEYSSARLTY